jgi:ATP-binding cassette subfamily F protein 3
LLATLDAPHLIILDEPTNHLDIESRDALVEGLTEYGGAVILVSHDPHLVELVAERLWLVRDGRVKPYDDDMDAYRRMLLAERNGAPARVREDKPKPRPAPRAEVAPLRAEVAKCEARVAKLEEMRATIDGRLANPLLYARGDAEAIDKLRRKRAEVEDGLQRAEALWLAALERLEAAGAG